MTQKFDWAQSVLTYTAGVTDHCFHGQKVGQKQKRFKVSFERTTPSTLAQYTNFIRPLKLITTSRKRIDVCETAAAMMFSLVPHKLDKALLWLSDIASLFLLDVYKSEFIVAVL